MSLGAGAAAPADSKTFFLEEGLALVANLVGSKSPSSVETAGIPAVASGEELARASSPPSIASTASTVKESAHKATSVESGLGSSFEAFRATAAATAPGTVSSASLPGVATLADAAGVVSVLALAKRELDLVRAEEAMVADKRELGDLRDGRVVMATARGCFSWVE